MRTTGGDHRHDAPEGRGTLAGFSVTVLCPTGGVWAQVCLAGSIDEAAAPQLAGAIDHLTESDVGWTFVDVASVTFATAPFPASVYVCAPSCQVDRRWRCAAPDR